MAETARYPTQSYSSSHYLDGWDFCSVTDERSVGWSRDQDTPIYCESELFNLPLESADNGDDLSLRKRFACSTKNSAFFPCIICSHCAEFSV